jgi:spore germination protein KB
MQEKGKISTNQYVWLLFSIITSFSTLQVVGRLIYHAGRDSWLSVALAWLADVILAVVYAYLGLRFPGESMVQYSISILGGFWGRIVGALFSLFFLISASVFIRGLCTLLSNGFFPNTPINVIIIVCFLIVGIGVKKGLEAFSRTSEILGPLYLLSFVVLFSLVIPFIHFDNLKPQLYNGFMPSLTGAPYILSFISICIMMGMFIPYCNKPANGFLGKFIAVTMGALALLLLVAFGIGAFGAERAGNEVNVGLELARQISLGKTIQRLEVVWLMVSVAAGIMSSISLIWAFSLGISQIAGLSTYKPLAFPSVLFAFILTITTFDNDNALVGFANYTFPFIGVFVESVLELFLLIMALALNKRGTANGS